MLPSISYFILRYYHLPSLYYVTFYLVCYTKQTHFWSPEAAWCGSTPQDPLPSRRNFRQGCSGISFPWFGWHFTSRWSTPLVPKSEFSRSRHVDFVTPSSAQTRLRHSCESVLMCRAGNVYGATPTSFLRLNAPYHVKSCTGNLDEALATLHFAIANSHNTRMHEQFAFRARIGLDKPSMLQVPKISNLGHVLPSDNENPSPSVQQTVNKKQRHIVQVQRGSLRPCTFALS